MQDKFFINIDSPETGQFSWSQSIELFFLLKGQLCVSNTNHIFHLKTGDILIINPFEIYSISSYDGCGIQLSIDIASFAQYCKLKTSPRIHLNTTISSNLSDKNDISDDKISVLTNLIKTFMTSVYTTASDLQRQTAEFNLISELILHFSSENTTKNQVNPMLAAALAYIKENYTHRITVHDIAMHCHISDTYLTHLFKDTLNTSPSVFLQQIRLQHARQLLFQPLTLSEIAQFSGFDNGRNFNAAFKKVYKQLPSEYRKANNVPASKNHFDAKLFQTFFQDEQSTVETYDYGSISANAPTMYHLPAHYFKLLEFDSADKLLDPACRTSLEECQKDFHFTYIHLRSIFDNGLLSYIVSNGQIIWNFTNLDSIFDFLLSIGLTPFITISSIPNILSSPENNTYFGFSNISTPQNMEGYRFLIEHFITHLLDVFGLDEIKKWKIGVNYMPSSMLSTAQNGTFCESYYIDSLKEPFEVYLETYKIIRSICPEIELCCPEGDIEDLIYERVLDWIIDFLKANNCVPDFFAFHDCWGILNQITHTDDFLICEREINYHKTVVHIAKLQQKLTEGLEMNLPLYCTNRAYLAATTLNETVFNALSKTNFLLHAMPYLKLSGIGPYIDFKLPSQKTTEFCGYWGFVTKHHIKRPFYYALQELHKLEQNILYYNEHIIISGNFERITIILTNTSAFSLRIVQKKSAFFNLPVIITNEQCYDVHSDTPLFTDIQNSNQCFDNHRLHVQFSLEQLADAKYLLESYSISSEHGSAYDEWLREGAYEPLSDDDCAALNQRSLPARIKKIIHPISGIWHFECTLEPCEIRSLTLELK